MQRQNLSSGLLFRVEEFLYSITIIIVIGAECANYGSSGRKNSPDAQQNQEGNESEEP